MQRLAIAERPNWREQANNLGFDFYAVDGTPYWNESAYYRFTLAQIEEGIEAPTQELLQMCYQAVEHIIARPELLRRFAIPEFAWDYIAASWRRQDKDLYGRFDLRYDGRAPAKLFEFNADTPTSLFEAAVFQWQWLEDNLATAALPAGADQFNSIHDRLIDAFRHFGLDRRTLHFAALRAESEDRLTVDYLEDCARQAGLATVALSIEDIGITADERFTDLNDRVITDLFKLYPWEWLLADDFGKHLSADTMRMIEPAWKMTLSNKGLLAVLWEMFPGHANLLPAFFEDDPRVAGLSGRHVRKPLLGREGSNVDIVRPGGAASNGGGPYGDEGFIVQALAELPSFGGKYPVIGSWVVAGHACGIGIREADTLVTGNTAQFIPHIIGGG